MALGVRRPRGNVFGLVWVLWDYKFVGSVVCVHRKEWGCAADLIILGVYWKWGGLGWVGMVWVKGNGGFVGECGVCREEGRAVLQIW